MELSKCIVLDLPVCLDLVLQGNYLVCSLVGFPQRKEPDCPNRDQERLDDKEGGQQFGAQRWTQFKADEAVLHRRPVSTCSRYCSERALSQKRGR